MADFDFSECVISNHHWQRQSRKAEPDGAMLVEWFCPNCSKRRIVRYSLRGGVVNYRYVDPPGYKRPKVGEALSRAEWRAIYLKNLRRKRKY